MYGYVREHCDGVVEERIVDREAFHHKSRFVILESIPIGVCSECGYRYYHSSILHRVEEIATGQATPDKLESVNVGHMG